jgi:dihydrolipoamide dehydrogenase
MKFKLNTKVNSASRQGEQVVLELEPSKGGDKEQLTVDVVLVSAGRRPYVTGLGLENVGITPNKRGQIEVDDHFRTNVPSIYAIGDCIPGPMLAHKAEEDGVAAVEIMAGKAGHVNYNTVPSIVYTHPEVASVGLSEEEAKAKGINYKTGKFSFMANSRARAVNDTEGMVKFISDKDTDKILGAWIMGPNAGELIPECVLAMEYGACTEDIARACHGHPTLSEAIKEAALATVDKPIHM